MGHDPLRNPLFFVLFLPLCLCWTFVSAYFFRNFLRKLSWGADIRVPAQRKPGALVQLMLGFMPLGYPLAALRELHLLSRFSTAVVLCASLTVGMLTTWVCLYNSRNFGAMR